MLFHGCLSALDFLLASQLDVSLLAISKTNINEKWGVIHILSAFLICALFINLANGWHIFLKHQVLVLTFCYLIYFDPTTIIIYHYLIFCTFEASSKVQCMEGTKFSTDLKLFNEGKLIEFFLFGLDICMQRIPHTKHIANNAHCCPTIFSKMIT